MYMNMQRDLRMLINNVVYVLNFYLYMFIRMY